MLFGSDGRSSQYSSEIVQGYATETNNIVNDKHGGYDHVSLYIPIAQPNAHTLAKLAALEASTFVEIVRDNSRVFSSNDGP